MRKRNPWKLIFIILFVAAVLVGIYVYQQQYESGSLLEKAGEKLLENAPEIFSGEPKEVRELRLPGRMNSPAAGNIISGF